MQSPPLSDRVSTRTKAIFALGSAAESIALAAIGGFALFYYNQVLGVPATIAGAAMSLGLVLDGFADPLVGSISDRTRSKLGRRHPFMFAAPVPVAIALLGVFNPPSGLPELWLFLWFAFFVTSLRVCMAVYHTPHLALAGEMSRDYTERSRVLSWNTLFGYLATAGTTFVALSVFFKKTPEFSRGIQNPAAYAPFSFAVAGTALVLLFASAWWTRDRIKYMQAVPENLPRFSPMAFLKDVGAAMTNRNYLFMLIGFFFISLSTGLRQGLELYINTFYWGLSSEQLRWFVIGSVSGFLTGFYIAPRFHHRFGKRWAMVICSGGFSIVNGVPVILALLGVAPRTPSMGIIALLIATQFVASVLGCGMTVSTGSALADVADENELRIGHRQEGVLYSTRTLFSKIDVAIGQFLAGMALDVVHFPKGVKPTELDPAIVQHLALIYGPLAIIPGVFSALFYYQYRLDRKVFEENRRLLDERRDVSQVVSG